MTLSPGARLGPCEIIARLGSGGKGEVYMARDRKLDRDVAIKVLPDHHYPFDLTLTDDSDVIEGERFIGLLFLRDGVADFSCFSVVPLSRLLGDVDFVLPVVIIRQGCVNLIEIELRELFLDSCGGVATVEVKTRYPRPRHELFNTSLSTSDFRSLLMCE